MIRLALATLLIFLPGHAPERQVMPDAASTDDERGRPAHVIPGRDTGKPGGALHETSPIVEPPAAASPVDETRPAPRTTKSAWISTWLVDGGGAAEMPGRKPRCSEQPRGAGCWNPATAPSLVAVVVRHLDRSPAAEPRHETRAVPGFPGNKRREDRHNAVVTAYTSRDHCAPDDPGARFCDGLTSSLTVPVEGRTLACPPQLDLGTKVRIQAIGVLVCEDRGSAIRGERFDIYRDSRSDALAWGRRTVEYEVMR